jgi:hypothetical protein
MLSAFEWGFVMRFPGKILALAPACALALLASAPAAAATMVATFTGDAVGLFDPGHNFGASNFVAFTPATATFTYDPTLEPVQNTILGHAITGGTSLSDVSPILSASLTINGHTLNFDTSQLGTISITHLLGGNLFDISTLYSLAGFSDHIDANLFSSGIPNSFTSPFTATGIGGVDFGSGSLRHGSHGGLFFTGLDVTELASGVPEPATWAMLLLGFGATGFALRRRRRLSVSATA